MDMFIELIAHINDLAYLERIIPLIDANDTFYNFTHSVSDLATYKKLPQYGLGTCVDGLIKKRIEIIYADISGTTITVQSHDQCEDLLWRMFTLTYNPKHLDSIVNIIDKYDNYYNVTYAHKQLFAELNYYMLKLGCHLYNQHNNLRKILLKRIQFIACQIIKIENADLDNIKRIMATNDLFLQLLSTSPEHYSLYGDSALDIIDSHGDFYTREHTKADLALYESLPVVDSKYIRINELINKRIAHFEAYLAEHCAESVVTADADIVTAKSLDTISVEPVVASVIEPTPDSTLSSEEIVDLVQKFADNNTIVDSIAPVSTEPSRSFCNKPFVVSEFLSEMHLYTLNDITNIVNEHKSELDSLYCRFIISIHTGKKYDDVADEINDRLLYAMLCKVNHKIIEFNLTDRCNKLVQKYANIYNTPHFIAKDLAREILQTKYKGGTVCITHLAKSYFSYLELLQTGLIVEASVVQTGFVIDVHRYN